MNASRLGAGIVAMFAVIAVASARGQQTALTEIQEEVRGREAAFARTMADRNLAAFTSFLSPEAVFIGAAQTSRGRQEITEAWRRYFDGARAPFSWRPETVEVLDSGTLALTGGPVFDPQGQQIGTFNSTWRRDADGLWRIIFDKGC